MNYMPEVAKMLGVELGERFNLDLQDELDKKYYGDNEYYLCEDGVKLDKEGYACTSSDLMWFLICGKYAIKRKPCKPKINDVYYFIDEDGFIFDDSWDDSYMDIVLYKLGNCYRTQEEAERNRQKWIDFYASDEVLEV